MKLIKIYNDLFDIAKRLNQIDKSYFIVFNKHKNRFEVHYKKQRGNSLSFVVENKLDASVLKKSVTTSIKFASKILQQIEKENDYIEKQNLEKIADENMYKFKSYIDYANQKNCDIDFTKVNQNGWI